MSLVMVPATFNTPPRGHRDKIGGAAFLEQSSLPPPKTFRAVPNAFRQHVDRAAGNQCAGARQTGMSDCWWRMDTVSTPPLTTLPRCL